MSWRAFREEFEARARRPAPVVDGAAEIPLVWRGPLARTLAVFQLGEGGEGRIAHDIDRARVAGLDADYRAALKLFVREEGRHARLLASAVRALGGQLVTAHWTERLFRHGRRLLGLRLKLLVLLAAEVVSDTFYAATAARLPAGPLRRTLDEIASDERRHLEFHVAFFSLSRGRVSKRVLRAVWLGVGGAAALVVLWDHGRSLRALGVGIAPLARRLARKTWQVGRRLGGLS